MPVLELTVDASQMQRGADQANAALRTVQTSAENTQKSITNVGGSLRNTFQAVGGVSQVGQGIAQTAAAFGSLNIAAGAFAASRTLLEISKTAQDFREMRSGVTGATSAWSALGAVMRAHPILTIATVLGAAASVMSLFGRNTEDATKKLNDQAAAIDRLLTKAAEVEKRTRYGTTDSRKTTDSTIDALLALRGLPSQTPYYAVQAASLFGVSEQELRYALGRSGLGESALELRYPQHRVTPGAVPGTSQNPYSLSQFTAGQLIAAGENILSGRVRAPGGDPAGAGAYGGYGLQTLGRYVPGTMSQRDRINARAAEELYRQQEEAAARVAASMEQAARYASGIAGALGAGVYDVLAGIQGWRQTLASIINQIGRQGLSDLGSSLAASLFKPSQRQTGSGFGSEPTGWTPASGGFNPGVS